jgi:hypothetical protein
MSAQLGWAATIAAAIGIVDLLAHRPAAAVLLGVALLLQLLVTLNYDIWDIEVFYLGGYVLISVAAAAGVAAVMRRAARFLPGRAALAGAAVGWVWLLLVLLPRAEIAAVAWRDRSLPFQLDYMPTYDPNLEARLTATVDALPRDALVYVDWETLYPYYYVAHIQRNRTDLAFIETKPADHQVEMAGTAVTYALESARGRPVFFAERRAEVTDAGADLTPARLGPARLFKVVVDP